MVQHVYCCDDDDYDYGDDGRDDGDDRDDGSDGDGDDDGAYERLA